MLMVTSKLKPVPPEMIPHRPQTNPLSGFGLLLVLLVCSSSAARSVFGILFDRRKNICHVQSRGTIVDDVSVDDLIAVGEGRSSADILVHMDTREQVAKGAAHAVDDLIAIEEGRSSGPILADAEEQNANAPPSQVTDLALPEVETVPDGPPPADDAEPAPRRPSFGFVAQEGTGPIYRHRKGLPTPVHFSGTDTGITVQGIIVQSSQYDRPPGWDYSQGPPVIDFETQRPYKVGGAAMPCAPPLWDPAQQPRAKGTAMPGMPPVQWPAPRPTQKYHQQPRNFPCASSCDGVVQTAALAKGAQTVPTKASSGIWKHLSLRQRPAVALGDSSRQHSQCTHFSWRGCLKSASHATSTKTRTTRGELQK